MVFIIAAATILATLIGGFFAIRFKDKLHLILGFSAGAVLGVALFDLLPEALELNNSIRTVALFIAIGFAGYLMLDRLFSLHFHDEEHTDHNHSMGALGALTLALHSFLDGLAIGLAFKISPSVGWVVAIAVLAHDFSDGINTVGMILKGDGTKKSALKWLILDAAAPALGIVSTLFFSVSENILGLLLAIFAGFFLYIGASDLIPESHHRHPKILTTITTLIGILVIFLAVYFAG